MVNILRFIDTQKVVTRKSLGEVLLSKYYGDRRKAENCASAWLDSLYRYGLVTKGRLNGRLAVTLTKWGHRYLVYKNTGVMV